MKQHPITADGLTHFDDVLGRGSGRYFATGHRRVEYTSRYDESGGDDTVQRVSGVCEVAYPVDWSLDAQGRPRSLHLSSIDALVICSRAVDHARQRWPEIGKAVPAMDRLAIRAGARPVTRLDAVPFAVTVTCIGAARLSVVAHVGGFTVTADIGLVFGEGPGGATVEPDTRAPNDPSLSGFVCDVDYEERAVTTLHRWTSSAGEVRGTDVDSPQLTLTSIDDIVLFGQVAQVLVQLTEGIARGSIENLWMRRMEFTQRHRSHGGAFRVHAHLVAHDVIERAGTLMHSLRMTARSEHGVDADAVFGFVSPAAGRPGATVLVTQQDLAT
ncbi:AvrD family protein [Streptomyces sp. AC495_CC817]|uniref:AvrD family protein n=1 Tax=Streptomyces sp. AC495_CC817 TaxID=2823900 RepID=UPI001C27B810|nr:AvrD family protein [Streptomyces sp. AC495_CC817]